MNLEYVQNLFNTTEGYFYRVIVNKSEEQILEEIDMSFTRMISSQGIHICTRAPIEHDDYIRITE